MGVPPNWQSQFFLHTRLVSQVNFYFLSFHTQKNKCNFFSDGYIMVEMSEDNMKWNFNTFLFAYDIELITEYEKSLTQVEDEFNAVCNK